MNKLLNKLKQRWEVETFWHVLLILFIFAITGISSLYIRHYFYNQFGFNAQTALWKELLIWIVIVIPSYQILFLSYGFLLGQFDFVWRFEKKSLRRIKTLFSSTNR